MNKIKIFLASSSELELDRREIEVFISRENSDLAEKGLFLDLIVWEDFIDAMARTRLQDEYNKAIRSCDIFLLLFFSKVGKYTREEFEAAFGEFQESGRPAIYTYFRNSEIKIGDIIRDDLRSLWEFQDRLHDLGHYKTVYTDINDFKYQFKNQLSKFLKAHYTDNDDLPDAIKDIWGMISESNDTNELRVLELLDHNIPRSTEDLIEATQFSKKKVNRIINRLVRKNKISRVADSQSDLWLRSESD